MTVADKKHASQPLPFLSPFTIPDIIPNILPACSVNLLAGASGVGKTALTSGMLRCFRDTAPVFGYQPNPVPKIAVITTDRSWASTGLWFQEVGYPEVAHYALQDDDDVNLSLLRNKSKRLSILVNALDRPELQPLPPGSLVMIDPFAMFLGGNLTDYDACMVACSEIRRLARQRQITFLGTAHSAKQKADKKERYQRLQDRILGSAALFGYTDTQMYLAAPEETGEKFYSFLWHPHHAPAKVFSLGRDARGLFVPWAESTAALEESTVLRHIPTADEGIGFGELVLICDGLSRATVHRHLLRFESEGLVLKVGYGRYRRPTAN